MDVVIACDCVKRANMVAGLQKESFARTHKATHKATSAQRLITLCEATARSTKFRKLQSYKNDFYQRKEALLLNTTLPCLKVFVSLITKNKPKSPWHTEKFATSRLKEKSLERMRTKRETAKSVASCVASQVLQVTDKLPSFPRKAEFSPIIR